jgi:hypothetical protein
MILCEGPAFLKGVIVPLQNESGGYRGSALADGDAEGRRTDRAGERSRQDTARGGRRGRDGQAQRGRRRFRLAGLADEEQGMPAGKGAAVQAARGNEIQAAVPAANLEEHRQEQVEGGRLLGDPQDVGQPGSLGYEEVLRRKPETGG